MVMKPNQKPPKLQILKSVVFSKKPIYFTLFLCGVGYFFFGYRPNYQKKKRTEFDEFTAAYYSLEKHQQEIESAKQNN